MGRSIRFRITAIAVVAVVLVLVVSGVALVLLQRRALTESLDEALAQRADDITELVDAGAVPETLALPASEGFAVVVDDGGQVIAATPNLAGSRGVPIEGVPAGDTFDTRSVPTVDDDTFRVLTRPLTDGAVLIVGTSYDTVSESSTALMSALALTIPAVAVVLGALVWWLVGRTLRPVEAMRAEVAEIGSTDLDRRVPQPGSGDEIDRLAETMNEMLARLERSVERQQQFVSDASHDLRSPLTRMRSSLEVSIVDGEAVPVQGLLDDVVEMQRMVEDLLYLARADEGRLSIEAAPLDLDDLVLREVRRLEARQRVGVDYTRVSGAHVDGDAGQLTRAIRNLVDNAERHASSVVTLGLEEREGSAILTVGDDGPGVRDEDAEVIFERFHRLDDARTAGTGCAGLGLAIARDIVERHGGTVRLLPSQGSGATFAIALPAAERSATTAAS